LIIYFNVKRSINVVKILSSFTLSKVIRKQIVWGMPISYLIEQTNHSNLKCPECSSRLGALTRLLGLLKIGDFKKLVDEINDTGFYIQLFFQGVHFINKSLPAMIS